MGTVRPPRVRSSILDQPSPQSFYLVLTFEVTALFLPESRTNFLYPAGERDLNVTRHCLIPLAHTSLVLSVSHHHLDPLDSFLAIVKATGDLLGRSLDCDLFLHLHILVIEPRQNVLLMQLLQLSRLVSYCPEKLCHLVLNVDPSWWQQVHLNDSISVIIEGPRRHEATPLLGLRSLVCEAIGGRTYEPSPFGGIMGK